MVMQIKLVVVFIAVCCCSCDKAVQSLTITTAAISIQRVSVVTITGEKSRQIHTKLFAVVR